MKGLEFPVGIAIDVGISTGNCSWLVAWLGWDVRWPSMFAIEKFISVLLSASCPNSERHYFPEMETQGNQILTIFLLEAGSVGFLFRTSTYTPVEDQAKFEAAYVTWVVSFCVCAQFLLWTCCLRINPRGQIQSYMKPCHDVEFVNNYMLYTTPFNMACSVKAMIMFKDSVVKLRTACSKL